MSGIITYFFRDIAVEASLGLLPAEKARPQRILIDLDYDCAEPASRDDRIESVLNYDTVRQEVVSIARRGHINLQETLCRELLASILAHPEVLRAKVSVRKPDIYPDVDSVGLTMEARRD